MSSSDLCNTTYQIHHASPLHVGTRHFSPEVLNTHAAHIRDFLVGNVLRGVRIGLTNNSIELSKVGALLNVEWTYIHGEPGRQDTEEDQTPRLQLRLKYEQTVYTVLFLRPSTASVEEEWESYPLLLIRMPAHLLLTIKTYLETTFDCSISQVSLTSSHVTKALETYLSDLSPVPSTSLKVSRFEDTVKDIQLSFSICLLSQNGCLKSIDMTVPKHDVMQFLERGQALKGKRQDTTSEHTQSGAFLTAVQHHIKRRMAFDITHATVQLTKVACGGFVMGDGRIKIFPPSAEDLNASNSEFPQDHDLVDWIAIKDSARKQLVAGLFGAIEGRKLKKGAVVSPIL